MGASKAPALAHVEMADLAQDREEEKDESPPKKRRVSPRIAHFRSPTKQLAQDREDEPPQK